MSLTEKTMIEWIRRQGRELPTDLLLGIGDDCCVIHRPGGSLELISTDALISGVHFEPAWHPPRQLGRKSAAVNLSDIAAMGGTPRFVLLALGLPPDLPEEWFKEFIGGMTEVLVEHGVTLVGGDTVASPAGIMINLTVVGEVPEDQLLLRSGALVGDLVMVSGELGDAAAGLELLRSGLGEDSSWACSSQIQAQLDPDPEVALGRALAASGLVHAMMDISDGLAGDLASLVKAGGVGAELIAEDLPISPAANRAAELLDLSALDWALAGGEDYRLLFTVAPGDKDLLMGKIREQLGRELFEIGRIIASPGVFLLQDGGRREVTRTGFEHFPEGAADSVEDSAEIETGDSDV